MDIKYFRKEYDSDKFEFVLKEVKLALDHWWYIQLDSSIKFAFKKFDIKFPKYVIVQESDRYTCIFIVRNDIKNKNELLKWEQHYFSLFDELNAQARANSVIDEEDYNSEKYHKYEFKVI